jgi:hypothetical protein
MSTLLSNCVVGSVFPDSEEIENPQTMGEDETSQTFTAPVGLLISPNEYLKIFYQ